MIYITPPPESALDQGDLIRGCPLAIFAEAGDAEGLEATCGFEDVLVLTQTCDLAQHKSSRIVVAVVVDAENAVESGLLPENTIRGQVRMARVFGWYFLPADDRLGISELIVDLRQIHTASRSVLEHLCEKGQRSARLNVPFREHLAKHFADTYSRIGLPEPYATQ